MDTRKQRAINFIRRYNVSTVLSIGFGLIIGLLIWDMLPAPYSFHYLFNRITKNPSFECKDGVYSFAATTQGACSGHGGIAHVMPGHNMFGGF